MIRTQTLTLPDQEIKLNIPISQAAPCTPHPTGLYWLTDNTGDFTEVAEAAYLGAAEAIGPVLAVAKVLGETCGQVKWSTTWTPDAGAGGSPALVEGDNHLFVCPAAGNAPGQLRVSAQCAGRSFGPIMLTLLPSAGGNCCPDPQLGEVFYKSFYSAHLRVYQIIGSIDDAVTITYSAEFTGTPPDDWLFLPPVNAWDGVLVASGGDNTTRLIVTADLTWDCNGPQARTLTWPETSLFPLV